jgi:hypothetical protein
MLLLDDVTCKREAFQAQLGFGPPVLCLHLTITAQAGFA